MSKTKHNENSNIVILPESDERTLCVSLRGVVALEEYEEFLYKPLQEVAAKDRKYGLLIHYAKGYKGCSREAADKSFKSIIEYGKNARKLAYVNPPESKIFQVKMAKPLLGGEIRFFEDSELDEALQWVKT
jgi:hypothetical protein